MSAAGVQRAIVRMMFDPDFRDAVYADAAAALAGCDVSVEERGWLVRPDRRAYATDGSRQARALHALEGELPAVMAWARAEARRLEDFFASPELHRCIEERGVLTLAFAAWLGRGAGEELGSLLALEAAVARARRGRRGDGRDGGGDGEASSGAVMLSPRAVLAETREGALEGWTAVMDARAAGAEPPRFTLGEPCVVLVQVDATGHASIEALAEGLAALLAFARQPVLRAALERHAIDLGLDDAEARELLADLLATGLLVPA